jgi:hypothetical protein
MQNHKELWISRIYFPMGKFGGSGARQVHHGPGTGAQWGLTGAQPVGCSGSPGVAEGRRGRRGGTVEALPGARAVAERWHDDGGEPRWCKLDVRAEECVRELKSERRGCALPFTVAGDAVVEVKGG